MPGYYWYSTNVTLALPSTAVEAGVDTDGSKIYVGRAQHFDDLLPAKIIPERQTAYVSFDGLEYTKDTYDVLCQEQLVWKQSKGSQGVFGAIEGGRTDDGERLFIGRVPHNGSLTLGKVQLSHGVCYIPYDGEELAFEEYEILVVQM